MRRVLVAGLVFAAVGTAVRSSSACDEIASVAVFARLYGAVRYFYPGDAAAALDWDRHAVYGVSRVRSACDVHALSGALAELFTPLGPGIDIRPRLPPPPAPGTADPSLVAWRYRGPGTSGAPATAFPIYLASRTNRPDAAADLLAGHPIAGAHVDIELMRGLSARVRLTLTDAEARDVSPAIEELKHRLTTVTLAADRPNADVRLADAVVAWNVFRHFYPYWQETRVDWDARLPRHLERARSAATRDEHRRALRLAVADAVDGHGTVVDRSAGAPQWMAIGMRMIGTALVVIGSSVPEAPVGAIVTSVNGTSANTRVVDEMLLASGSDGWKAWRTATAVALCPDGSPVRLGLSMPDGSKSETTVTCTSERPPTEPRPAQIAELAPGTWYVDLTRASWADVSKSLSTLAGAKALVFDVRGYPTDAGSRLLPHLMTHAERSEWMHTPYIVGPFGNVGGWHSAGWNVKPALPALVGRRVFLTDGRAISYAESVMGYVADHKLGTIVGSATAGTNGNVATFRVPGGFTIMFTGMRVTRHDGRTPFHLVGVQPDIHAQPTLAGVRDGRDEVLERALAITGVR